MQEGILMFDQQADRVDIRFDNGDYYGGLHCGTPVEVWLNGQWFASRIELSSQSWFLVGVKPDIIWGLRVRIVD